MTARGDVGGSDTALVLVVDDDLALQFLARESLEPQGFTVEEATDGEAGVEAFSRVRPDVVLLDVNMPMADGFTVCSRIRQMAEGANTPVVMMTAADDVDAIHTAYEVGATDFITKPLNWTLLGYRLRYVLRAGRTRARLAVSEARLARAQQISRLGDWEVDLATGTTTASVEARRIFGLDGDGPQVDDDAFWARVHPDDRTALSRALSGQTPEPARLDVRVVLPDEERVAHFQAAVVGDDRNRRVVATIQDVTDRTWLEAQLRQSQKMEAVGKLAGGIAHDFSNLLTIINLRSRLLLDRENESPQTRRDVEIIREAGERAVALTGQLLAFSRNQVLERKPLDLNGLVTDLDVLVSELLGEAIVRDVTLFPELATVSADPIQIEQVILNLVVNARDAMPDGGQLWISTANVDLDVAFARRHPGSQPGRHVALTVRDTGVGMDPELCARIFEPFFTTKGEKGTGLGLATVYGIVKQHGGYISVDSEPGRGTTFTVYLAAVQSVAGRSAGHGHPSGRALPAGRGGETVLLAEDDPAVRELVVEFLEHGGFTVIEASDGREAFDVARAHAGPIDLLLTDVTMPKMSGPELARELTSARGDMKVLFVSGCPDDALRPYKPGMEGIPFLAKPFPSDRLLRKVREVLDATKVS